MKRMVISIYDELAFARDFFKSLPPTLSRPQNASW